MILNFILKEGTKFLRCLEELIGDNLKKIYFIVDSCGFFGIKLSEIIKKKIELKNPILDLLKTGENTNISEVFDFLNTPSMFCKQKLLIAKNLEFTQNESKEKFINILKSDFYKTTVVILNKTFEILKDGHFENLINKTNTITFDKNNIELMIAFLFEKFKRYGKYITRENLCYFIKLCNFDIYNCNLETNSLANLKSIEITNEIITKHLKRPNAPHNLDFIFQIFLNQSNKSAIIIENSEIIGTLSILNECLAILIMLNDVSDNKGNLQIAAKEIIDPKKHFLLARLTKVQKKTKRELIHFLNQGLFLESMAKSGKVGFLKEEFEVFAAKLINFYGG